MAFIIDDIINGIFGTAQNDTTNSNNKEIAQMTNEANERLADKNNAFNREMWDANNAYNSPASQISRFKAAGLNPALIYGSSGNAGNSPAPVKGTPATAVGYHYTPANAIASVMTNLSNSMSNIINTAKEYQDLKVRQNDVKLGSINAKYQDALLNNELFKRKTFNKYYDTFLLERNNKLASEALQSWYAEQMANLNWRTQTHWYNNYMPKSQKNEYDQAVARLNLLNKQGRKYDDEHELFTIQKPMFESMANKAENDANFFNNDIFRGIDKGMDILGGIIDMLAGGVGVGRSVKMLLKGRRGGKMTSGPNGDTYTDWFEK